jgi:two-component system NtrC family sensor kinase
VTTERQPRVLVVDDDAFVGNALRRVLAKYDVTFAQSAVGALARIEAGGDFAAIVCDLFMPGMTGVEFHDRVAALDPQLARRVVFVSGATGAPELSEVLRRTGAPCLPKPFDTGQLRAAVEAAAGR